MMYLIEYMSIHDTIITIAVGDPKSLIDVICTLDKSTRIRWWKIKTETKPLNNESFKEIIKTLAIEENKKIFDKEISLIEAAAASGQFQIDLTINLDLCDQFKTFMNLLGMHATYTRADSLTTKTYTVFWS